MIRKIVLAIVAVAVVATIVLMYFSGVFAPAPSPAPNPSPGYYDVDAPIYAASGVTAQQSTNPDGTSFWLLSGFGGARKTFSVSVKFYNLASVDLNISGYSTGVACGEVVLIGTTNYDCNIRLVTMQMLTLGVAGPDIASFQVAGKSSVTLRLSFTISPNYSAGCYGTIIYSDVFKWVSTDNKNVVPLTAYELSCSG